MRACNFKKMVDWLGDYNTLNLTKETMFAGCVSNEVTMQDFEMLVCLIYTEFYKGLQEFLRSDDMWQSHGF